MTLTTERKTVTETAASDRRRPGRADTVNPELIPLLRTSEMPMQPDDGFGDDDQLSGMRGIFSGLALSIPIWLGVAYVGRWLFS